MLLFPALILITAAPADEFVPARDHRFSFAGVPTLAYSTDEGFGTGGVVTIYHQHDDVQPYRDALTFNVFISSKLVQHHAITWDALKPFDVPGRSYLRLGYYSTVTQNYCGVGNAVLCPSGEGAAQARELGLVGDAADEFARHYFQMRFIRPYITAIARPWLRDKPFRTELLLGWRGGWTMPGDLFTPGPYAGSLFEKDHPDGEAGISSVPFVGLIVDDRDTETFPMRGFVSEASVRGSSSFLGGTWSYVGMNASIAGFFTMKGAEPRLVFATRAIGDVILGDPSIEEMARIGGTIDAISFGGFQIGRGIREHRYVGKLKVMSQSELRAQFIEHDVFGEHFSHGAALFTDIAWLGFDVNDFRGSPAKLLSTVGASYRVLWNESFAIRFDLGISPDEVDGPGFYIIVGQAF